MIRRLKLVNVRKHVRSEYFFTDEQLIMFAGPNGAGKSTILEAIFFALYGQTRHGRRGIAEMVNREGWHEGMEVEVDFVLGQGEYSVKRRFEKGKSTAVLKLGDSVIMQGADEVSGQVAKLFGVDANGFRLAAVTRQKDVQGLLDMTSGVRMETIGKILKLTELRSACKSARGKFRQAQSGAEALLGGADIPVLEGELAGVEEQIRGLRETKERVEGTLVKSRGKLNDVLERRHAVGGAVQEIEKTLSEWEGKVEKMKQMDQLLGSEQMQFKQVDAFDNIAELNRDKNRLSVLISEARGVNAEVQKGVAARREIARLSLVEDGKVEVVSGEVDDLRSLLAQLGSELLGYEMEYAGIAAKLEAVEGVVVPEGVCYACGQGVEEELHQQLEHKRLHEVDSLSADLLKAGSLGEKTRKKIKEGERRLEVLIERLNVERKKRDVYVEARAAIRALEQSVVGAAIEVVDVGELEAQLEVVEGKIGVWEQAQRDLEYNREIGVRRANAEGALTVLKEQVEGVDEVGLRDGLKAERVKLESIEVEVGVLSGEVEEVEGVLGEVEGSLVGLKTSWGLLSGRLQEARAAEKLRGELVEQAEQWSGAAALLEQVAGVIGQQHRPKLEVRMTELLSKMSAGRFDRVRVLPDYGVEVADVDGKFYPVSEFSGGEVDLIALSLRLALASTLGNRTKFVILDEVFGSQDDLRRDAIIEGLRGLADEYSQILLISHVGGMDEVVDRVVEL